jgi:hypothetical protein
MKCSETKNLHFNFPGCEPIQVTLTEQATQDVFKILENLPQLPFMIITDMEGNRHFFAGDKLRQCHILVE